ncbi:flagella basal body P-ring formation protein FlgA [Caulobacter sp. CCUG 60055]|uniref:flagellar basal body P-ring formation chaperone FlgA n=1 Tax=Caulobacter sp. CCUG 60055 TaxID=2100090 RepID=UPI001FA7A3CB|nr:flagellar basal body P-ring formation chaperone FlgA [Caulobacter sp. CCUG 60055]MBQ1542066.1 flagellar basal body P-ring formation protein FlgA [Caulobacteraceae bacterium]MCI3180221.1 flagella basal body P-ring formation protein FlgA [Caulobacter sp. CCUG 60055]
MTHALARAIAPLALAAAAWLSAGAALAGQPVSLKVDVEAGGPVTLGDLFDDAGRAAGVVIGPAPQPGANAVLDAAAVQRAAHLAGLDWDNPSRLRRIVVRQGAAQPEPAAAVAATRAGKPGATVEALTYTRSLAAGEVVGPQDVAWTKVAAFSAPKDAPGDAERVIGMAARRPLRAGAAVTGRDLAAAQVIKRDDLVTVTFSADGVRLSLQGKAMAAAAAGDTVAVMNVASKKVFEAVAAGPGQAVVGPEADRLKAAAFPAAQFASLR